MQHLQAIYQLNYINIVVIIHMHDMNTIFPNLYLHVLFSDPGYGPSDPCWVGAWWVGYLTGPCLLLIAAILIALFPRTMPTTWKREEEAIEMTIKTKIEEKGKENVITGIRVDIFVL